jgi:hypothetical protein
VEVTEMRAIIGGNKEGNEERKLTETNKIREGKREIERKNKRRNKEEGRIIQGMDALMNLKY